MRMDATAVGNWQAHFEELAQQIGSCFARVDLRRRATAYVRGLLGPVRQVVEHEGQAVLEAQRLGTLSPAFTARDCRVDDTPQTRVYLGVDGVIAPMVTMAEKRKRRENVLKKRRAAGHTVSKRPLAKVRGGADQKYKEMKLVMFYDEHNRHQHVVATRHDHRMAGALIDREARRLKVSKADEIITNTDAPRGCGVDRSSHRRNAGEVRWPGPGLLSSERTRASDAPGVVRRRRDGRDMGG